jgi:hypothetical protein
MTPTPAGTHVCLPLPGDPFRGHNGGPMPAMGWPNAPDDRDDLALYRWWIGHQLTFCVWRLLSEQLISIAREQQTHPRALATSIALYDVCSVLLLYTGSCSPEVHLRTIRPAMAAADPAFSGRWARDYRAIPGLLRAIPRAPKADAAGLLAAARTNQVVHMAVAKRLVPDGPSLLRQSDRREDQPVTERERDLFDAFFLVKRADMSRSALLAQLRALTRLVASDVAERPLHKPAATWNLPTVDADLITKLQRDVNRVLRDFLFLPLKGPCG